MRTYLPVILLMLIGRASFGQSINTAEKSSQVRKTTRLQFAVKLYRDGLKLMQGVQPVSSGDYHKAYSLFKQAADMGDAQSLFARSYLEFKHLGTDRSDCYESAAKGFFQGALAGRDNSMYFYGLCLANGYGVVKNVDSAKYWLQKSAATGYKQAIEELKRPHAENANDSASSLLDKINQSLLPKNRPINEFVLIEPQIPASSIIAGHYTGYVLHFDWSGKYLISSEPLELSLENSESESEVNGSIKGLWTEKGGTPVPINATLSNDSVIFKQTEYKIKDHYSWDKEITYDFNSASLSLNQEGDSVFLYGNVQMYSPERGEPAKPIYLALVRTDYISSQTKDSLAATNKASEGNGNLAKIKKAKLYPNPFKNDFTIEFQLTNTSNVGIQLLNMNGKTVYTKKEQLLKQGKYTISISPGRLASGMYILRIVSGGNDFVDLKAVRE